MSTTAPIPWDCHAHHRRSRMQVHRLHYLGIGLCQAASQYSTESLGPVPTIFHLVETFLTGEKHASSFDSSKGKRGLLKPVIQFPTHPMKRILSKAEKLGGLVIFPTEPPCWAPQNSPTEFPGASSNNQRANYLLTMLQGVNTDLGPPVTLGGGHTLSTAQRGLLSLSDPNFTSIHWLSKS